MGKVISFSLKLLNQLKKMIFIIMGIICIWYFIKITSFIGYLNVFNLIWVFIGIVFMVTAVFIKEIIKIFQKQHKLIKVLFLILTAMFLLSFIIVEGLIIINAKTKNSEDANYLMILGAGLNGDSPSLTLMRRINTASHYSKNNPNVKIIASGGKGNNSKLSEAEVISRVLQNNNVDSNQITIEDKSKNTYENLKYAGELIDNFDEKIVIVSSEFHLFRIQCIAKNIGYKNIGTLASRTPSILLPNYYVREYFAIVKEWMIGNI